MQCGAKRIKGRCIDVSLCGLGLWSRGALACGSYVRLTFSLPSVPGICPANAVTVDGVVARTAGAGSAGTRLGIEFTVIETAVATMIASYVVERVAVPEWMEMTKTRKYVAVSQAATVEVPRQASSDLEVEIDVDDDDTLSIARKRDLEALCAETQEHIAKIRRRRGYPATRS